MSTFRTRIIINLQFENQFFAQRVALEQTVGSPLPN